MYSIKPLTYNCLLLVFSMLLLCTGGIQAAHTGTPPSEESILAHWRNRHELPVSVATAALIAEGAADSATFAPYRTALRALEREVESRMGSDIYDNAEELFSHLHSSVLHRYTIDATVRSTLDSGHFNCATAVVLFTALAQRHNIPVVIYTTPAHVYCTVQTNGRKIRIELTDPEDGFDVEENIHEVIDHMVKYKLLTQEEVDNAGYEEIYREYFDVAERIDVGGLLGTIYYNVAVAAFNRNQFDTALSTCEKAILLDSTSYNAFYRSLLYHYTNHLHNRKDYRGAADMLLRVAHTGTDSTTADLIVTYADVTARNLGSQNNDYHGATRLLDSLHTLLGTARMHSERLLTVRRTVEYERGMAAYNVGNYGVAFTVLDQLRSTDSSAALRTDFLYAAIEHSRTLVLKGHAKDAYYLLDSLIPQYHDVPKLREIMIAAATSYTLQEGLVRDDGMTESGLTQAIAILKHAYSFDSSQVYFRTYISRVYSEYARMRIADKRYDEAIALLDTALTYDATNSSADAQREYARMLKKNRRGTPAHVTGLTARSTPVNVSDVTVKVTFTSKIVDNKPFDRLSAIHLYDKSTVLYMEWKGLKKGLYYSGEIKVLNSTGKEIRSQHFSISADATEETVKHWLTNNKDYSESHAQIEIYLEGKKMFERALCVF